MIIATAPGRCGIVGNPTDMYGGSVVSCSTAERATCTLIGEKDEIRITVGGQSQDIVTQADLALRDDDYLNVARAVLLALEVQPGVTPAFHLEASTEIPMQAGLAGSTAILATIVGAVLAHLDLRLNSYEVAELVRKIEYDVLRCVCGFQDHYMATFGGLNFMDFRDKNSAMSQDYSTPYATIEPLAPYLQTLPFVLAHTGVKHHSGTVHKSIRDRWLEGELAVVDGYVDIARLARTGKKALLAHDWDLLAELMTRNHEIQRDLGGSGESNEVLIAAALGGGAMAAKLAGAGGGGTILALTLDPERTQKALLDAGADKILFPMPCRGLTVEIRV
ncbi:MAG: mevalonate kinase [Capsulimonas sp.]|jgi:galactokinase/mevalonate kinase-like predicted kinase|nr:mevalonate kinase [Capsulimonas sp.]